MHNLAMKGMLEQHQALDVNEYGKLQSDGTWKMRWFVEDVDYCDAKNERWIRSIGKKDGAFYAATDGRFEGNPDYELVWLR